ncbi:short-chain dehydrogenase/reductase family 16C member 6-like [Phymastichus coffea]|uniref:short-chain dehydrogenase/reductase family 16C member 6-like n=1 Tax=Phymastichus coffea TaxID=108790 RepID=UPI00273B28C9|nr:short-chain dehydrogenase/reductase family 16C member 6-like [Phymastichus coffea]
MEKAKRKSKASKTEVIEREVVKQGIGSFNFSNGDSYEGRYMIVNKKEIYRHGYGIYRTYDGDAYEAVWDKDTVCSNFHATYGNKAEYIGELDEQGAFSGKGTYIFPDGTSLTAIWKDNHPRSDFIYTDPLGHEWYGRSSKSNQAENNMWVIEWRELFALLYDSTIFVVMSLIYALEAAILTFVPRRYRSKNLREEVALVTGAAGGIGRLIAQKLASKGCSVVAWDINQTGVEETAKLIQEAGGKCWAYHCDVSDREKVYKTAKAVKLDVGNVTILINNAGYVYGSTLLDIPDDEIEMTFKVNIISHYWTTKAFLKEMMRENHGHIVTIASVAGLLGTYNCTDYCATKFAACGYHESLFTELRTHGYDGIQATLVCPYFINTGMFSGVKPRLRPMLEPEYVASEVVAAIGANENWVILPRAMRYFLPLKFWMPAKMCWALMYHIIQGPQTMMMMKARKEFQILRSNNRTPSSRCIMISIEI